MSRISRETLKWLQSLDFNPGPGSLKRFISNGYVIAKILSIYYPKTVDLSYYSDTNALDVKMHNWECLCKAFKVNGIPIRDDVLEATLHGRESAAELLLHSLHSYLTGKSFKGLPSNYTADDAYERSLPNYAKSTAIHYIRKNSPSTDQKSLVDTTARYKKISGMIERHECMMLQNREKLYESCADRCLRYTA